MQFTTVSLWLKTWSVPFRKNGFTDISEWISVGNCLAEHDDKGKVWSNPQTGEFDIFIIYQT
jgi:hypothetical protein